MNLKRIFITILISLFVINGFTQDLNFLLYSNTSLNINPAIISANDNFKVAANYNNRSYINHVNTQLTYLMISRPLFKDNNRYGGFGLSVYSNKGGNTQLLINEGITGAYSHEVQLTSWSRLSLGIQASYIMKRIDTREYTTGSQWIDGVGYDPTAGNGEEFERLTTGNFTLSSGLFWYIPNEDRTIKFSLGFAMYNLTKPKYSFFGSEQSDPIKYIANTAYEIYSGGKIAITPQLLYYNSYYRHNWIIGSKWAYKFTLSDNNWYLSSGSIELTADYQINEGAIVGIQVNQPSFSFGIGYGFSDKYSNQYTPDNGAVEISFAFKKSLYKNPKTNKKVVVDDHGYYEGQLRDLDFKKYTNINVQKENEKIDVDKLKNEPGRDIKFKLQKDFNFGFNDAQLNEEAKSYIDDIVLLLNNNDMLKIEIIGHTDNVGTKNANQKISEKRAEVVKNYLIEKGIDKNRIKTRGEADKYPLYDNDTKENRSKNRRVEFVIYY